MRSVAHVLRTRHGSGAVIVASRKSGGAVRAPGAGDQRVKRKRGSRSAAAVAARIDRGFLKRIRTAGSTACVNNRVDSRGTGTDGSSHPAAERTSTTARDVGGDIVKGDEGPVSGVAQVVCHGVRVVGVHGEEEREEDGKVQGEVKGEVEQLREKRTCAWREDGMTDSRDLSQVECDVSVRMTRQPKQRAGVLRPTYCACRCTSCHCCHCPLWSSRC